MIMEYVTEKAIDWGLVRFWSYIKKRVKGKRRYSIKCTHVSVKYSYSKRSGRLSVNASSDRGLIINKEGAVYDIGMSSTGDINISQVQSAIRITKSNGADADVTYTKEEDSFGSKTIHMKFNACKKGERYNLSFNYKSKNYIPGNISDKKSNNEILRVQMQHNTDEVHFCVKDLNLLEYDGLSVVNAYYSIFNGAEIIKENKEVNIIDKNGQKSIEFSPDIFLEKNDEIILTIERCILK